MTAPGGNKRAVDPRQASLFDASSTTPAGTGRDLDLEWRAWLNEAIKQCPRSRAEIAAEIKRLIGDDPDYPISVALLNAWTAASKTDYRFPLIYLPAFIRATGADWLLERLASKLGRAVVTPDDAQLAEALDQELRWSETRISLQRARRARYRAGAL